MKVAVVTGASRGIGAAALHPLGRISTPAEVAALAAWLGSDEASFATGQAYVLDGGLTAERPSAREGLSP